MSFADRAKAKAKQAAGEVIADEQIKREGLDEERPPGAQAEGPLSSWKHREPIGLTEFIRKVANREGV